MNQSGSAPLSDSDCKDLSNLMKQYMNADGILEPEKAPPDMRVSIDLHRRPNLSLVLVRRSGDLAHERNLESHMAAMLQDLLARLQDIQKQTRSTQQQGLTVSPEPG